MRVLLLSGVTLFAERLESSVGMSKVPPLGKVLALGASDAQPG